MQQDHAVLVEVLDHLVEVAMIVVDDRPAAAPSRHAVDLRNGASANDGHIGGHVAERDEGTLFVIRETVVHLVGNDGNAELISDGEDLLHVRLGEAGAAGVRGVVHEDSLGALVDLRFEVLKIDFPILFSNKVIADEVDTKVLADRLAKRESGVGHEHVVSVLAQSRDRVVERAGAAERQEHVVRVDRVLVSAILLGDCLSSLEGAAGLGVAISHFGVDGFNHGIANLGRQSESVGLAGLAKTQVNNGQSVVGGRRHFLLQNVANRVKHISALGRGVDHFTPGLVLLLHSSLKIFLFYYKIYS